MGYFDPVPNKVRIRDFVRELPHGVKETAKNLGRDSVRFVLSAKEVPGTLLRGKATGRFYDTPVGRINSFQSEAQNRVNRGDPLWKAIAIPAAETIMAGSDLGSMAGGASRLIHLARAHKIKKDRDAIMNRELAEFLLKEKLKHEKRGRASWTIAMNSKAPNYKPRLEDGIRNITTGMPEEFKALDNNRFASQARQEIDPKSLMKILLQGKKNIVLDDAHPINPRDYNPTIGDVEQMMIDAGYRTRTMKDKNTKDAIRLYNFWKLKDKAAFKKFSENPQLPPTYIPDSKIDDASRAISRDWEIVKGEDKNQKLLRDWAVVDSTEKDPEFLRIEKNWNDRFGGVLPESYGSDITDSYLRSFHPNRYNRSFKTTRGKERFKYPEKPQKRPKTYEVSDGFRIISGGQTGADQGALFGAREMGIRTGGTAPKGWKTDIGSDESLKSFGLREHTSSSYVPRTIQNINDSDATIATLWGDSVGTGKTIGYAQTGEWKYGVPETKLDGHKPVLVIKSRNVDQAAQEVKDFIQKTGAKIINFAGHRESSQPGIEQFIRDVIKKAFTK